MMESQILRTLRFEIGTSTSYTFATRFLRFANADDRVRHLTYVRTYSGALVARVAAERCASPLNAAKTADKRRALVNDDGST